MSDRHPQTIANERHAIDQLHQMCMESLSPEVFEAWETVRERLIITRNLTPTPSQPPKMTQSVDETPL